MSRRPPSKPSEQLQLALCRIEAITGTIDRTYGDAVTGPLFGSQALAQLRDATEEAQAALIDLKEALGAL